MLDYDRKVARRQSNHERCYSGLIQTNSVPRASQDAGISDLACFCTLLGLCYNTLQLLKGTQKEKYSIDTLYDETVEVLCDLDHLEN